MRLDLSRAIVDRHDRSFSQRRLLERDRRRMRRLVDLRDLDLDQVARLEQVGRRRPTSPGKPFAGQLGLVADRCAAVRPRLRPACQSLRRPPERHPQPQSGVPIGRP